MSFDMQNPAQAEAGSAPLGQAPRSQLSLPPPPAEAPQRQAVPQWADFP